MTHPIFISKEFIVAPIENAALIESANFHAAFTALLAGSTGWWLVQLISLLTNKHSQTKSFADVTDDKLTS